MTARRVRARALRRSTAPRVGADAISVAAFELAGSRVGPTLDLGAPPAAREQLSIVTASRGRHNMARATPLAFTVRSHHV